MTTYEFRLSLAQKEVRYELGESALVSSDGKSLLYAGIKSIRLYIVRAGLAHKRCVVRLAHGPAIMIASRHFLGIGSFEDRSDTYDVFVTELVQCVAAANPAATFVRGMPLLLWSIWAILYATLSLAWPVAGAGLLLTLLGEGIFASLLAAAIVLIGVPALLYYFIRALAGDWPRRFAPRIAA